MPSSICSWSRCTYAYPHKSWCFAFESGLGFVSSLQCNFAFFFFDTLEAHRTVLTDVELLTTIYSPVRVSLAEDTSNFFWVSLVGLGAIGLTLGGVFAYRKLRERGSGGGHVLGGGAGGNSGGGGGGGQGFRPMPI